MIDLRPAVTIHESGDSVTFGDDVGLIAGPSGFVAIRPMGRGAIAVYDSAGRLVRSLGPKGRGPGEFLEPTSAAFGPGDSLFVSDRDNLRLSVLSPDDQHLVRTVQIPGEEVAFRASRHHRLLSPLMMWDRERRSSRFGLRVASWDGSAPVAVAPSVSLDRFGSATSDTGRGIWVADRRTYSMTLFDGQRIIRTVKREPDWFPADTSPIQGPAWLGNGRPFITDMSVADDGRLWVLIKRKNPRYSDTAAIPRTKYISPMGLPPLAIIFEGVLEVLDPVSGALIDSRVVPGDMIGFIGPGRLYQKTDADSSGVLMLRVWEAKLKPGG